MTKRTLLTLLGVVAVLVWAVPALAATTNRPLHPYYSSARAQIGNGLPIPITFDAPPYGRARPLPGATAMQGTTGTEPSIVITKQVLSAPLLTRNIGVWKSNNKVFQVQTSLILKWPAFAGNPPSPVSGGNPVVFKVNGRPGPASATWCPGLPPPGGPTASYNPSCAFPKPSTDPRTGTIQLNSALKYNASVNQFGGIGQGQVLGGAPGNRGAVVAVKGGVNPPCTIGSGGPCLAAFDTVSPANTQAGGGPWGFKNSTPGTPAVVPGVRLVNALGPSVAFPGALGGTITAVGPAITTMGGITLTGTGAPLPGFTNKATSWGGPWTAGTVVLLAQNTANLGTEQFTLSGSDSINTANGTRLVSLVTGAVSQRTASKPNANRGWLTLFLPEPGAVLGTLGALLALAGCHRLTRRR